MPPKFQPTDSLNIISGISTELDAPLRSLSATTQKLINDYKSRDFEYISYKDFKKIISTLEQINRQINRCSQTTTKIINLRPALTKMQSCDINKVVRDIGALLDQQLSLHKIKLQKKLTANLGNVRLGAVECDQIVHNVVINAIQAMPGGGIVKISTQNDKNPAFVRLTIADNGVGITPDHLEKVFEPFFTTHEQGVDKSVGLGLSIVRSIVTAVGGTIQINSSLRRGTEVVITLPKS